MENFDALDGLDFVSSTISFVFRLALQDGDVALSVTSTDTDVEESMSAVTMEGYLQKVYSKQLDETVGAGGIVSRVAALADELYDLFLSDDDFMQILVHCDKDSSAVSLESSSSFPSVSGLETLGMVLGAVNHYAGYVRKSGEALLSNDPRLITKLANLMCLEMDEITL